MLLIFTIYIPSIQLLYSPKLDLFLRPYDIYFCRFWSHFFSGRLGKGCFEYFEDKSCPLVALNRFVWLCLAVSQAPLFHLIFFVRSQPFRFGPQFIANMARRHFHLIAGFGSAGLNLQTSAKIKL